MGKIETYVGNLVWKPIYINGEDTGHSIAGRDLIKNKQGLIDADVIKFNNKEFKIDRDVLYATVFVDNPNSYSSVRNWGLYEWYLDKTLIANAIDIEKEFWFKRKPMKGSEEARVKRACELMENPEMRLVFVSAITGVSKKDLYAIRMGTKWNDIAKNYVFPVSNYKTKGPYKNDQIHQVCEMLTAERTFRYILVERMTGVKASVVNDIRFRKSYQNISMFYEFCYKEVDHAHGHMYGMYTPNQIRHCCFLLEDPSYSYKFISEFCNMNLDTIYKIRDGRLFTEMSKDFDVRTQRLSDRSMPYLYRTIQLLNDGKPIPEIVRRIQMEYNIPNKQKATDEVNKIRREYLNVTGSTTIIEDDE